MEVVKLIFRIVNKGLILYDEVMKNSTRDTIVAHEKKHWDKIFSSELRRKEFKKFSSFWWEDYYAQISQKIESLFPDDKNITVLEVGSGSGKASFLVKNPIKNIALVDVSNVALQYARFLKNELGISCDVSYHNRDFFSFSTDEQYDLCWSIGMIEHYDLIEIQRIVEKMLGTVKPGGFMVLGVPNKNSGPTVKARVLATRFLKWLPGYKLDTENFYSDKDILSTIQYAAQEAHIAIIHQEVAYCGNPMIMETPKFILKTLGVLINKVFARNRFLKLYIIGL